MITTSIIALWMFCWWITEYDAIQNFITNVQAKTDNYFLSEGLEIWKCWKCTTFTIFMIASIIFTSQTLFFGAFIYSFASMVVTKILRKF